MDTVTNVENIYRATLPSDGARARAILEKKIETGRASALNLFERIHQQAPRDSIAKGTHLDFGSGQRGLLMRMDGGAPFGIHRHALSQIGSRAGVPVQYLSELANAEEDWKRDLASDILDRHYHRELTSNRFLVRQVNGEVRGFLSDKYRRLDSRPLIEAFAGECQKIGAVPVDGTITDVRVALKAILPEVYEPVPGEAIAFGLEWFNSDFGAGLHSIRAFILRLWCLNGATMENSLAQVHLGRKLAEDIELSQRTYDLDTRASVSALQDIVAGTLAPEKVHALCEGIRTANEKQIDWKSASAKLRSKLLKSEMEEAKTAFESDDVINLPEGKSVWRVSNALSWIAGRTQDADRKIELQRIAGQVIHGHVEVAEAA